MFKKLIANIFYDSSFIYERLINLNPIDFFYIKKMFSNAALVSRVETIQWSTYIQYA